ncbi:OmpA family protein [Bacillus sp. DNRA2]|uniref:OmpA family protein n=1 Tax=Bacillus sp. DNRA2 TaxID=2723053 RepID=UPI00145CC4A5|nr:OmpA family protein [Bacillus sp. DNRA2]
MARKRKLKKNHEEDHIDETWLIPYSDLLTLLLALFIVLFSMRSEDMDRTNLLFDSLNEALNTFMIFEGSGGEPAPGTPGKQPSTGEDGTEKQQSGTETEKNENGKKPIPGTAINDKEEQKLQDLMSDLQSHIEENNLNAEITLNDISQGIQITLRDRIVFDSGSDNIKVNFIPSLDEITKILTKLDNPIIVEGHTDNRPIHNSKFTSNWELSGARAAAVLHYFQNNGISPNRLSFTGYGEFKPIAANDTPENRELNRRVNIIILRK